MKYKKTILALISLASVIAAAAFHVPAPVVNAATAAATAILDDAQTAP